MKAICIKKIQEIRTDNPFHILLNYEILEVETIEEKEFGILFHNGKYRLTNGTDIIGEIEDYIKIEIKENE